MDRIPFKDRFSWPLLFLVLVFSGASLHAFAQTTDIPALPPLLSSAASPALSASAPFPAPFTVALDASTRERAAACLATAVYYESAGQPREGQEAVAQVVLNRVRHPNYPKSVCGVVYQGAEHRGCQFTFACDGSLKRTPSSSGWRTAQAVADQALSGFVAAGVGSSTHYHTMWVHPTWSSAMTLTRRIGAHQFYKFPGEVALTGAYAGVEPAVDFTGLAGATGQGSIGQGSTGQGFRRALAVQVRPGRATPAPQAASFIAWGLQIATVTPRRGGLLAISDLAGGSGPAAERATHGRGPAQAADLASGS